MEDTLQLRQTAIEKLSVLPKEKLVDVLAFIDFITVYPRTLTTPLSTLPAPDAFLECAGSWEFEPGELEEILRFIEQTRLLELEEDYGDLLD